MNPGKAFIYQTGYSTLHPEMYDIRVREIKAKKILAVLADYFRHDDIWGKTALDVGCSLGIVTHRLSTHFEMTYGIDIDSDAVAFASDNFGSAHLLFKVGDGLALDLPDSSVDVVVCNQVLDHVPDSKLLMTEIHRLLRPGGVCYFSTNNRLRLIDPHYHLPLLSVLPQRVRTLYVRLTGRSDSYYENPQWLWDLRALTSRFRTIDYTERVLREPTKFCLDTIRDGGLLHTIVPFAIHLFYFACPNYIWLLEKAPKQRL